MMHTAKNLMGYTVRAVDGDIGEIHDIYFNDYDWFVRYIVVNLDKGSDQAARRVLLSPHIFKQPEGSEEMIQVVLNREMVMNSPNFDTENPLSRQQEIELHTYYQWPFYWNAGGLMSYPLVELETQMKEHDALPEEQAEPHLRSAREVIDYSIRARDGDIGHLADFLVDGETWKIQYILVDTGNWLPGRKVILSPQWIQKIDWSDTFIQVDLNKETIRNSPEYDPNAPLDEAYQKQLFEYYIHGKDGEE